MGEVSKLRTPGLGNEKTFESIDKIEEIFGRNITMDKDMGWHGVGYSQDNKIKPTAEDKIMNGFLQQDNKYKIGK